MIGDYKDRLEFWKLVEAEDSVGAPKDSYERDFPVWGSVETLSGKEYWEAQKANSETEGRIKIRRKTGKDVKPTHIIKLGDRTFEIIAVMQVDKKETHILYKEAD